MVYTRGSADDYDNWGRVTGDKRWSWNALWPYILKVCSLTYHCLRAYALILTSVRTSAGPYLQAAVTQVGSTTPKFTGTVAKSQPPSHGVGQRMRITVLLGTRAPAGIPFCIGLQFWDVHRCRYVAIHWTARNRADYWKFRLQAVDHKEWGEEQLSNCIPPTSSSRKTESDDPPQYIYNPGNSNEAGG